MWLGVGFCGQNAHESRSALCGYAVYEYALYNSPSRSGLESGVFYLNSLLLCRGIIPFVGRARGYRRDFIHHPEDGYFASVEPGSYVGGYVNISADYDPSEKSFATTSMTSERKSVPDIRTSICSPYRNYYCHVWPRVPLPTTD